MIDYLTFTSKIHDVFGLVELLGLEGVGWQDGRARNGWSRCLFSNGIRLMFGGRDDVCADMTGKGCRFLESCHGKVFDWLGLFDHLKSEGDNFNVSRLDVACDETEGILSMKTMVSHTNRRYYISRARNRRWIAGDEESIIFGAPTSDTRLRIYNKALERGVSGHWIRAEFQLRNEAADSMMLNMIQYRDIGRTYGGVLNNYLRYTKTNPADCKENYDRVETTSWWLKFVGTAQKIKNIRVGGLDYNLMSVENYLITQVASSMKTLLEAYDGDAGPLLEIAARGKLNKRQKDLLRAWEIERHSVG